MIKPEEAVELVRFLGIESAETLDAAKAAINEGWVPSKTHKEAVGELHGKLTHSLTKIATDLGIEVDRAELKGKQTLEIPTYIADKFKAKLTEVEGQKSATTEQAEAKWKGEVEKWKTKATDLEGLNANTTKEFETFKTTVETEKRNGRISAEFGSAFGKLPFSNTVSEFTKKGFEASLREKYKFDLDGETPVVRDSKGEAMKSKVNAGQFATFAEIIETEFKAAKDLAAVADPKKVHTFGAGFNITPAGGQPQKQVRQVAPRH